jgi:hypothetical protein
MGCSFIHKLLGSKAIPMIGVSYNSYFASKLFEEWNSRFAPWFLDPFASTDFE